MLCWAFRTQFITVHSSSAISTPLKGDALRLAHSSAV